MTHALEVTHSQIILAYAAGLFDGEGSIGIGASKKRDRIAPSYWLQVGVTNTDRDLIAWLYTTFGGHISDNSHSPSRVQQRPCWAWRIMSNEAAVFLTALLPYLRVKKVQAELAIRFQEHMRIPLGGKAIPADVLTLRERFRAELRQMTFGKSSRGL